VCKVKSGAASLSSFLTLLEYYGLKLQHLSPNSIALVAIFVHLYEMYVGVRPSVQLFRCFFLLKAASTRPLLIGGHYFQHWEPGHAHYIALISPGRWERWREDWALVQANIHDRLVLPVSGPTLDHTKWGKDPGLEPGFNPVFDRIQYLAKNSLTSLMVLHDFLSKRLAPLQDWPHRPAWMYTEVNASCSWTTGPGLVWATRLKALTMDQPSAKLVMPAAGCEPLCVNQAARTALLAIITTLDDVNIAPVQRGDQSRGVVIPGLTGPGSTAGGHNHGGI
jgi:hypothetical protein